MNGLPALPEVPLPQKLVWPNKCLRMGGGIHLMSLASSSRPTGDPNGMGVKSHGMEEK
jgi:hypothetical protein